MARMLRTGVAGCVVAVLTSLATPARAPAQTDSATPGARYHAGGLHRWLFGSAYRDLWTTPVTVPVLGLDTAGGGLRPTGTGSGQQTLGLRFVGADGRPYTFRSLDKDPTDVLPPELRETFAAELVQDQISSAFPTAPRVVEALLEAVGIIPRQTALVILPDDPALGDYRAAFAHRIGTFEEWANDGPGDTPGFAGATDVLSSDELRERLTADPRERVDLTGFLTARLIDVLVGDWDRHRGQWRWGNIGGGTPPAWVPFPEDRDQAFAKYDGLLLGVARYQAPQLTNFGPNYSPMVGATWNGRDLDRWLLVRLDRPQWDSVAAWVTSRITDEVIDGAVSRLPPAHERLRGAYLRDALRRRRDGLRDMAGRYFHHLASEVDLYLTNASERVVIERRDGGDMTVSVRAGGAPPYLTRTFSAEDTREIRLYLGGGDDSVLVHGNDTAPIKVRVVSDAGRNVVQDDGGHKGTVAYDSRPNGVVVGQGVQLDSRPSVAPPVEGDELPPRDWGTKTLPLAYFSVSADLGLVLHGGLIHDRFGFRKLPRAQHHSLRADFSTGRLDGRLEYSGELQRENSPDRFAFDARASGIEISNFYGFGNNTGSGDRDFFKVYQNELRIRAAYQPALTRHARLTFGVAGRYSSTNEDRVTLVSFLRPYGIEDYGRVSAILGVDIDTRDREVAASRGLHLALSGTAVPGILDVDQGAYGRVDGSLATYLTPAHPVTLGIRVGGARVWGNFPFMDAAFLGSRENLLGFRDERYAGDATAYLNGHLRVRVGHVFLALPTDVGLVGTFDAGRVWYQGDSPGGWHTGIGGGLWLAPLRRPRNSLSLLAVRGEEHTLFYLRLGFGY